MNQTLALASGSGYEVAASQMFTVPGLLIVDGNVFIASHATSNESEMLPVEDDSGTASAKSQIMGNALLPKVVQTVSWSAWLSHRQSEEFLAAARLMHNANATRRPELASQCRA